MEEKNLYHLLNVASDATQQEIRKAYLTLAKTTHPDKASKLRKEAAEQEFAQISAAWEVCEHRTWIYLYCAVLHCA